MSKYQDIFLALELHNDWFQAYNDVAVRFTTAISVVELVLISVREIIGIGELENVCVVRL
jgi:hypothetical protein